MSTRREVAVEEIPVSQLKAHCSEIIEKVSAGAREFVITKRGVPVARLTCEDPSRRSPRGAWRGLIQIEGDIVHTDWSDEFEATQQ
jgi:prevent-host-death family protein